MKDSIYGASPADVLHEIAVGSTAASSRNIYTISQWSHMKERNAWHSWHCLFSGPCSKIRSWDRNRLSLDGPVRTRSFKYSEHFCGPSNTSCWGILWNIILPFVFLVCASFCVEALFKSNIQVSDVHQMVKKAETGSIFSQAMFVGSFGSCVWSSDA